MSWFSEDSVLVLNESNILIYIYIYIYNIYIYIYICLCIYILGVYILHSHLVCRAAQKYVERYLLLSGSLPAVWAWGAHTVDAPAYFSFFCDCPLYVAILRSWMVILWMVVHADIIGCVALSVCCPKVCLKQQYIIRIVSLFGRVLSVTCCWVVASQRYELGGHTQLTLQLTLYCTGHVTHGPHLLKSAHHSWAFRPGA